MKINHPEIGDIKKHDVVYEFWIKQPEKLVLVLEEFATQSSVSEPHTLASLLKSKEIEINKGMT